jgi:hypothetical protein
VSIEEWSLAMNTLYLSGPNSALDAKVREAYSWLKEELAALVEHEERHFLAQLARARKIGGGGSSGDGVGSAASGISGRAGDSSHLASSGGSSSGGGDVGEGDGEGKEEEEEEEEDGKEGDNEATAAAVVAASITAVEISSAQRHIEIDRRDAATLSVADFLSEYAIPKRPVVISGLNLTRVPWTLTHLANTCGGRYAQLKSRGLANNTRLKSLLLLTYPSFVLMVY